MSDAPLVLALSHRQLAAYNRADIDAFAACFHSDVVVLDHTGARSIEGIDAFRAKYGAMFAQHRDVFAEVSERVVLGAHVVELERWSRTERSTGVSSSGTVIVRYTEQDGLIRWVEFLRP